MRFKRISRLGQEAGQLDIAPLIDVVFQLLIFFMLTSSFIAQPGIRINLPKAVTSETLQEQNAVITVTRANLIYLNSRKVSFKDLTAELKKIAAQKRPLLIKSDRSASLGRVVEIWDLCRSVGINQVNIATNP